MPITKSRAAISQLTASGQSSALNVSGSEGGTLYVRHVNGAGTLTVQGQAVIEVKTEGGANWFTIALLPFGLVANDPIEVPVPIPIDAASVRADYTAPSGSTGHSFDMEAGLVSRD